VVKKVYKKERIKLPIVVISSGIPMLFIGMKSRNLIRYKKGCQIKMDEISPFRAEKRRSTVEMTAKWALDTISNRSTRY
jgi:hypothetical protein